MIFRRLFALLFDLPCKWNLRTGDSRPGDKEEWRREFSLPPLNNDLGYLRCGGFEVNNLHTLALEQV
jgi:hypothetical protein